MNNRMKAENGRLDPGPVRAGEYVGRVPVQVRYAETDAQAVVYHSNFLVYFEVGRTEWMKESGIPYTVMEEKGFALFIAECHLRYLGPAAYDDNLIVETRLVELRTRSCTFYYRVLRDGEEESLVEGWTSLVCTGKDRKVAPLPGEIASAMRSIASL